MLHPLALCVTAALLSGAAGAEPLFAGADLALGERLIREHRCTECHIRQVGGDGSDIYRPFKRIHTPGALRGMVEQCNTQLSLQMFPEEVTAVAAVLQRDHYKFDDR
ncbi:MAG: hypothetical protein KF891_23425 [Rhizobacter sp.]|nr:hypothetical protein [Rhizobacter sp.]